MVCGNSPHLPLSKYFPPFQPRRYAPPLLPPQYISHKGHASRGAACGSPEEVISPEVIGSQHQFRGLAGPCPTPRCHVVDPSPPITAPQGQCICSPSPLTASQSPGRKPLRLHAMSWRMFVTAPKKKNVPRVWGLHVSLA